MGCGKLEWGRSVARNEVCTCGSKPTPGPMIKSLLRRVDLARVWREGGGGGVEIGVGTGTHVWASPCYVPSVTSPGLPLDACPRLCTSKDADSRSGDLGRDADVQNVLTPIPLNYIREHSLASVTFFFFRPMREIPEETRLPTASLGTIPTCENLQLPGRGLNQDRLGGRRLDKELSPDKETWPTTKRKLHECPRVQVHFAKVFMAKLDFNILHPQLQPPLIIGRSSTRKYVVTPLANQRLVIHLPVGRRANMISSATRSSQSGTRPEPCAANLRMGASLCTSLLCDQVVKHPVQRPQPNRLPPWRTEFDFRGIHPDLHMWESCLTMPLVGGFSGASPPSPRLFIPELLHTDLTSPSSALKTLLLTLDSLLVYKYAHIKCALVVCSDSGGRRFGYSSPTGVKHSVDQLIGPHGVWHWRTLPQSSSSTVTADNQCAADIGIFVHKSVEYSLATTLAQNQYCGWMILTRTRLSVCLRITDVQYRSYLFPTGQPVRKCLLTEIGRWAKAERIMQCRQASVRHKTRPDRRADKATPGAHGECHVCTMNISSPGGGLHTGSRHANILQSCNPAGRKSGVGDRLYKDPLPLPGGGQPPCLRGREIPENTRRPAASHGTIPTGENPGVTRPGIEPSSSRWEVSSLPSTPPRLSLVAKYTRDTSVAEQGIFGVDSTHECLITTDSLYPMEIVPIDPWHKKQPMIKWFLCLQQLIAFSSETTQRGNCRSLLKLQPHTNPKCLHWPVKFCNTVSSQRLEASAAQPLGNLPPHAVANQIQVFHSQSVNGYSKYSPLHFVSVYVEWVEVGGSRVSMCNWRARNQREIYRGYVSCNLFSQLLLKLDPRSDLRSTQKTVAPFEFRVELEIEMKYIHFKPPKLGVRDLDPRSAAIVDK
ncbi:hypothetical protein PR048_031136 [Dryococelus australis]|uniref:Uncharacterized protein n=1 Tax=Dryococelus australis TaxID=614101 RepID=A0ABQ9G4F1_9NEOP|nr:hypothetical protein PR048_031136 [Dryococelus australis]